MSDKRQIHLKVSDDPDDDDLVAYLTLPDHLGGSTRVQKNVRLRELVGDYLGPDIYLDFDERNALVGIEILD